MSTASSDDVGLFGEDGVRSERVEWGNRWPQDSYASPAGQIEPAASEQNARYRAEQTHWGPDGPFSTSVVKRTVVTYTTRWTPADQTQETRC
ncbi:hypothetical protein [Nocardioides sp.]|uniref:hypothetical protein n=1 Tax=Nocardioides sp. TaxID=35761 RepID=UPI0035192D64